MSLGRSRYPKVERHILHSIRDEVFAIVNFLRHQWYIIAALALAIVVLAHAYSPLPPKTVTVATGQENSTLEALGKYYQSFFANNGVTLQLVPTAGAIESLDLLKQGKVDVALSQGGAPLDGAAGIVSLGSVGYQPLWFFYRGPEYGGKDLFGFLKGKRISIGMEGSGTRTVVDALMAAIPDPVKHAYSLVEMGAPESAKALREGEIDGMFLVAGIESANAQALIGKEGVTFLNFPTAEAMTKYIDYSEVVTVPAGAMTLSPPLPSEDVQMIATTTTVLTHKQLHPAIQHLFLEAATRMYRSQPAFFDRKGGFPNFVDKSTPRSEIAQRYITSGPLLLEGFVPFWVASFFDIAWFWMIAFVAVGYPLVRMTPSYRKAMFSVVMSEEYGKIFSLYREMEAANSSDVRAELYKRYVILEDEIVSIWVPKGCSNEFGLLLNALYLLRARFEAWSSPLLSPSALKSSIGATPP